MPEKEGKYPCQYCNKPCRNPQSKKAHERACPKNPNRHIGKKGVEESTNVEFVEFEAETSPELETEKEISKDTSEEIPKEPELSEEEKREIAKEDEALRKFPTIAKLIQQSDRIEAVIAHQTSQEAQIGNLGKKFDGVIEAIKSTMSQRQANPTQTQEGTPKTGTDVGAALDAGLKADKGQSPGSSDLTQTKMDQLRREAKVEPTEVQTGQDEAEQTAPDAAALTAMQQPGGESEGMQKLMVYLNLAERIIPLIRGESPESAQTPGDQKALERSFQNMMQLLRVTDGLRKEVRKETWDDIQTRYTLTPKIPPTQTQIKQPTEEASSEQATGGLE